MDGKDVGTFEEMMEFWKERDYKADGETVSSEASKAALRKTLNLTTKVAFMDINMRNYRANLEVLKCSNGIEEIDGLYSGGSAIIVAAGPSLEKNIESLRVASEGGIPIFCVDAAYPMLIAAGIEPDFVCVIDTKDHQVKFFECQPLSPRTVLLAIACISPKVIKAWRGEYQFFNTYGTEEDEAIQLKYGRDFGSIGVGGNVSTALMWISAIFCEATTIIMVGHDFSTPQGSRYYATGGVHALDSSHKRQWYTWDINGDTVTSDLSLWAYKGFTEDYAKDLQQNGWRVINATEGGILGTTEVFGERLGFLEYATLEETLTDLLSPEDIE